ncbi:TPA: hypothetical protein MJE21_005442 [Klebsiella pneumoniae]|nr:hypothetical protein [Klebsiella pneumoniae]
MIDLINTTRNHHFISQVEQRWNASSNPDNPSLARICKYEIVDKSSFEVHATNRPLIKNTSAKDDLYTLELFESGKRLNLEEFFGVWEDKYNKRISSFHSSIMYKIESNNITSKSIDGSDLIEDVKYLQKLKFLNFIRNPHNIKKSLKSFSFCKDFIIQGDGEEFESIFNSLVNNDKRQRDHICSKYGVSPAEYDSWLKLIILFVYYDEGIAHSSIDGMIEEYFKAKELCTTIIISYYTNPALTPLVPDIGSIIYPDLTYLFNVSKNCFVLLKHTPIDSENIVMSCMRFCEEKNIPYTEEALNLCKNEIMGKINTSIHVNDKELLESYNRYCIKESVKFVYSASPIVVGAKVIKKT